MIQRELPVNLPVPAYDGISENSDNLSLKIIEAHKKKGILIQTRYKYINRNIDTFFKTKYFRI